MGGPILVGDVGGTNVRFALAVRRNGVMEIEQFQKLPGASSDSFEDALRRYLDESGARPASACFALAGPIENQEVTLTNRQWNVSAAAVKAQFGLEDVRLINDFHAMARAVPEYEVTSFDEIISGTPKPGAPKLVAGPGTGFGVATLLPGRTAGEWHVVSGEGGHMAYAPRTAIELELTRLLARDHGYVSNELLASGSGLEEVHRAFCEIFDRKCLQLSPQEMRQLADDGDEMFRSLIEVRALTVMGAVGDLVLANGALGGVVLAGGVTERISDFLKTPLARARFVSRGPMSGYLEECPIWLMHDAAAPLIGAAADFEQTRNLS